MLLRVEMIGQHRPHFGRDDRGWYALAGWRARPWLQPIAKVEDFRREARGPAYRISAVTFGANVELPGAARACSPTSSRRRPERRACGATR